jgi:phenylpropionate dioxygenase-like ring-hydroxylating dioxygenase large terminal subunit
MISQETWFIAARSDQLKHRPLSRTILDRPIVLFRDSDNRAIALEDRCPHKGVSLSLGRVNKNSIECPYHGLCFDATGNCTAQPSSSPGESNVYKRIPAYPITEQDDWIWVYIGHDQNPDPPPRYKKQAGYGWFELHNVMQASMSLILDNGLDCSHTGFVHRGLFRSQPSQLVDVDITETDSGFFVETRGEKPSGSIDLTALATGGGPIKHTETFVRPHTLQVDYWSGKAHFVTYLICTPEQSDRTRVYTRQGVRFPPVTPIATLFLNLVARKIVSQDKRILENQMAQVLRFGESFHLGANADAPSRWLYRELKSDSDKTGKNKISERVEYKL